MIGQSVGGTATATVARCSISSSFTSTHGTTVTVTVTGASGTPTGTVQLTSGTFTSATKSLCGGSATYQCLAGIACCWNRHHQCQLQWRPDLCGDKRNDDGYSDTRSIASTAERLASSIDCSEGQTLTLTVRQARTATTGTCNALSGRLTSSAADPGRRQPHLPFGKRPSSRVGSR